MKYSYSQSSCKQTSVGAGLCVAGFANYCNVKTVFAKKKLIISNKFLVTRVRTKGINLPKTPCTVHLGITEFVHSSFYY